MSVQKKLETLGGNSSIVEVLPTTLTGSLLNKGFFIKSKEIFQVSSDRKITVSDAGWGVQGDFKMRDVYTRNAVLEIKLPPGTYTTRKHWGLKLLNKGHLEERTGSENQIRKNGWCNVIQTLRECDDMNIRDKYMSYTGDAVVNPTTDIYAYVFLNIQCGSINSGIAQYYPNYQLNSSNEIYLDFGKEESVVSAGTAPPIFKAIIYLEYANTLHNSSKKPKFDMVNKITKKTVRGGDERYFHECTSYEYKMKVENTLSRSKLLRSFKSSEIDELVFFFTNATDIAEHNILETQPLKNIKLTLSNEEIIDSHNTFQEIKSLWRHSLPNVFKNNNNEKHFYVLDLTPLNYKRSEIKNFYIQGVVLSEEDVYLEFDVPTDVAGTLYIYAVMKTAHMFKNGGLKRLY